MIAVAGCVAQAEGGRSWRGRRWSTSLSGRRAITASPISSREARHAARRHRHRISRRGQIRPSAGAAEAKAKPSAFVTAQEGCDKFCTFCVVPYTRGAEFSRSPAAIIAEVRALAARGAREITLLGQNVNAYHGADARGPPWSLASLLKRLARVPGIERLRFTTSHPRDMDDGLIGLFGDEPKLMPYLHLPFQSGSDRILAAMNRKHTAEDYEALIGRVRVGAAGHRALDRHHRGLPRRE